MKWRTEETPLASLLLMTGLAVMSLVLAERSVNNVQQSFYDEKLRAAKTMMLAMNTIKSEEAALGLRLISSMIPMPQE